MVAGAMIAPPIMRLLLGLAVARKVLVQPATQRSAVRLTDDTKRVRVRELMELVPPPSRKSLAGESIREGDYARFLSVCSWNVECAADLLRRDLTWRRKVKPRGIRYSKSSDNGWVLTDHRTPILKMPVTLVTTAQWQPQRYSVLPWQCVEENKRHINFCMEEMVRKLPKKRGVTGAVMLLDMQGFKLPLLVPYVRDGVVLCQAHYPCRLGAIVAYNLPACFPLIWRVVRCIRGTRFEP